MHLARCQAKYFAHFLDKSSLFGDVKQIAATISNSKLDLNPHQIEAALFALSSPFSNGVILADEVGLGKTIEAGIILSQKWSLGKQKILIILPPNLINQWCNEINEKFFIPTFVMDSCKFSTLKKEGYENPFLRDEIVICTYNFAYEKNDYLQNIDWDVVVFDEAHRLLNVYKKESKISRTLRSALAGKYKILLTATPFMNTLMELYGITTFVDSEIFGEADSFESQYILNRSDKNDKLSELSHRTKKYCIRTLRRQVLSYIHYTERICMTQEFSLMQEEQTLYDLVTEYLHKNTKLYAISSSGRALVERGLWKRLASSSFAIAGTLNKFIFRLKYIKSEIEKGLTNGEKIVTVKRRKYTQKDVLDIEKEIKELENCVNVSKKINKNSKGEALLSALENGFKKLNGLGAKRKTLIFTESCATQKYIKNLLESNGYKGKIVTINGANDDIDSIKVYEDWLKYHGDTKGSLNSNKKAALIDYFKNHAEILIATESASEGLNMQFCSLVINYDLPWNPQRIEQRIGRLHRYGQKNDVVVMNFLNKDNVADRRVYELLRYKFKLFDGVFGASDSVLGAVDSLDFETRVADIYSRCRTREEIVAAFDLLQKEYEEVIIDKMEATRNSLLSEFDDVVSSRFELNSFQTLKEIKHIKKMLWNVTKYRLSGDFAEFNDNLLRFSPKRKTILKYHADELFYGINEKEKRQCYRVNHALAKRVIFDVKMNLKIYPETIDFEIPKENLKLLENIKNKTGVLALFSAKIGSFFRIYEEALFFVGITNDGIRLTDQQLEFLMSLPAKGSFDKPSSLDFLDTAEDRQTMNIQMEEEFFDKSQIQTIENLFLARKVEYEESIKQKFDIYFQAEEKKLNESLRDKKLSLDIKKSKFEKKIKEKKAKLKKVKTLAERIKVDKEIKELNEKFKVLQLELFEKEAELDKTFNENLSSLKEKMNYEISFEKVFMVKWRT